MKKKDLLLLSLLRSNARMPILKLSTCLHNSRSSVITKMRKLFGNIIEKYTTIISFQRLGYVHIFLAINVKDEEAIIFKRYIQEHPCVNSVYIVNNGFLIEMIFTDYNASRRFVDAIDKAFFIEEKHLFIIKEQVNKEVFLEKIPSMEIEL